MQSGFGRTCGIENRIVPGALIKIRLGEIHCRQRIIFRELIKVISIIPETCMPEEEIPSTVLFLHSEKWRNLPMQRLQMYCT